MTNRLILKRSSVAAKVPLATDLEPGELAVNLADQKLYSKRSDGTVILVGTGAGDVQGPASSTDNALVRFSGTNGKVIKNSSATLDDSGNLLVPGLVVTAAGGIEGGEIKLAKPQSSTNFTGNIVIDIYENMLRIFADTTGGFRGAYLNLGKNANGLLWNNGEFTSGGSGDVVWVRFPNGFTIQTGTVNMTSGDGVDYAGGATFPRAFSQVVRPIVAAINAASNDPRLIGQMTFQNWTTTGLTIVARNNVNNVGSVFYVGYIVMGWS